MHMLFLFALFLLTLTCLPQVYANEGFATLVKSSDNEGTDQVRSLEQRDEPPLKFNIDPDVSIFLSV